MLGSLSLAIVQNTTEWFLMSTDTVVFVAKSFRPNKSRATGGGCTADSGTASKQDPGHHREIQGREATADSRQD
ncbi:hypothetical protein DNTS_024202 [Danionella cerebrum]|uniref:Uncharacterized protein n=1 Tax=Danionella cerebrum TaxID=2873325 RepID=A0A553RL71_9TELE|nr:hypothetical protein DNTS_024202 [Danionella translucida]